MRRAFSPRKSAMIFGAFTLIFLSLFACLYYFGKSPAMLTILMFTPAASVLIAKAVTKEGFSDLRLKPNFKGNLKWYLSAYLLTPLVAFFGAGVYFVIFRNDWDPLLSVYAASCETTSAEEYIGRLCVMLPLAALVNPVAGILQCFGEELAWRGYLLPKLKGKFGYKTAVVLDGVIWGAWHAPIIAMGYNYGNEHPLFGIPAMTALCVVLGVIESFLYEKTRSVWCPTVFHAALNGMDMYSPSSLFMSAEPDPFIGPDLTGIIGGMGFVIIAAVIFTVYKPKV